MPHSAANTANTATAPDGLVPSLPLATRGCFLARDFRFANGESLPELRLAYTTLGDPAAEPVLVLHGTNGSAAGLLTDAFAGQLFGPGGPLDARQHLIVIPDAIGAGASSKPSDGLRMRFPKYGYGDMVRAQHLLVTEHLGLNRFKLILGHSMGGMHAWLWGCLYPDRMRNLVPMACTPAALSGRNWLMRRVLIDAIRRDPTWAQGEYARQPENFAFALASFQVATSGGHMGWQHNAPTRDRADELWAQSLAQALVQDANDTLYQYEASMDYDPAPLIDNISARVLAINAADDERNPPELGITERVLARIPGSQLHWIAASTETRGHASTTDARWYRAELARFLGEDAR